LTRLHLVDLTPWQPPRSAEERPGGPARINDQWRLCFVWRDGGAELVEIVDYH
jgi:hypothetical protein